MLLKNDPLHATLTRRLLLSLCPQPVPPIPEETIRVARSAFPRGNLYLTMHDECGVLFADDDFATLFSPRGQPAAASWRLALITILQYVEDLSDRQAAEAVRSHIDWKYILSLARLWPFLIFEKVAADSVS